MRKPIRMWAVFIMALWLLAGCAPRVGTSLSESMGSDELYFDLPVLVIDFDNVGQASINLPAAQLGASSGINLDALALSPEWVGYFTTANIQHLQIINDAQGLTILVNGQPVPSLVWDEDSLVATAETVGSLGIALPVLDKVLPLVQQMGLGIALRFPLGDGVDVIPLGQITESPAAATAQQVQQEFLAAVGTPPRD